MPLNKEVCKKCMVRVGMWWCKLVDEQRWEKGEVMCYPLEENADVNEKPPKECPYVVEHTVSLQPGARARRSESC